MYEDVCVLTWFDFVEYGLYMFRVACMIFASDVVETFAIALLFIPRNDKHTCIRTCVL